MSTTPSIATGLIMLNSFADFLDSGDNNATFIYYDSTRPESVNIEANNDSKIASLSLPKPCFKKMLEDGIELHPSNTSLAIKTGRVQWARLYNGEGVAICDFSMELDIILNNYEVVAGSSLSLDSIVLKPSLE